MLAAGNRLRRHADFVDNAQRGMTARGAVLSVRLANSADATHPPRAGFTVGRRVGPAVLRNRIRRQLRHLVRPLLVRLPHGTTLVVRAQPTAAHAPAQGVERELDELIGRLLARQGRDA